MVVWSWVNFLCVSVVWVLLLVSFESKRMKCVCSFG